MDTQQFPKWYGVERRNEVLEKIKAKILTREGAVLSAIVVIALIALVTGMFYVVTREQEPSRAQQEIDRQRMKSEMEKNTILLPPEEAAVKRASFEKSLTDNSQVAPVENAAGKEQLFRNSAQ